MAKKKTTRKKATRKKARSRRSGVTLRSVSTSKLQEELERRGSDLSKLEEKRDSLLAQVEELDAEIDMISAAVSAGGGGSSRRSGSGRKASGRKKAGRKKTGRKKAAGRRAGGRKRAKNAQSLEVALAKVLKGKTMGVSEVADAVQKAGYKTTSPNFRTIVNQCLLRSDLIKKKGRGAYTAA